MDNVEQEQAAIDTSQPVRVPYVYRSYPRCVYHEDPKIPSILCNSDVEVAALGPGWIKERKKERLAKEASARKAVAKK